MTADESSHSPDSACHVAILTPTGRGAVASLVVFGRQATAIVARLFLPANGTPLDQIPSHRIVFGRWQTARPRAATVSPVAGPEEELVVVRRDPETIEVHCHGGTAAVDRIVASLAEQGCRHVAPTAWLADQHPDRLVAEARLAITQARTERTASILLDQVQGHLSRSVQDVLLLLDQRNAPAADTELQQLLAHCQVGQHLTAPWRIVLAGATNVGKSSLINAVLGYQRALVCETAGTTRDVLTDVTAIDGWPVELADTAGLRQTSSHIEQEGIRRARQQADSADLLLLVADLSQPWPAEYQDWIAQRVQPCLIVHNKSDLVDQASVDQASVDQASVDQVSVDQVGSDRPPGAVTNARDAHGIDELVRAISQQLVPAPPPPGTAVPFLPRHERRLRRVRESLQAGAYGNAERELQDLLTWNE